MTMKAADDIINYGYTMVEVSKHFCDCLYDIAKVYGTITQATKDTFRYPERTDGFLPFGMEHSNTTNRMDLCERFCYRHKYRRDHKKNLTGMDFVSSKFYEQTQFMDEELHGISHRILTAIHDVFMYRGSVEIRDGSYSQLSYYDPRHAPVDRECLQDVHEDGHLLTIVAETHPGLVIHDRGQTKLIDVKPPYVVVFSGSLLTLHTDFQIRPTYHSVKNIPRQDCRASFAYFAIPTFLAEKRKSMVVGKDLDFEEYANNLHGSFGNTKYKEEK
jgi:hypothetical protein